MTLSLDTAPFWARLAAYGDRTALVTESATLSYAELAGRVESLAARLGGTRRLVAIEGNNDVGTVVSYLAALAGGHPAILVPSVDAVMSFDPDVVFRGPRLEERRPGTAHDLHPSLALLLSTSGSTGSPKLVRLSHENLVANSAAIASYLQIRETDVAPTTLPMHYCYGLSVVNSHLSVGATILLTDESVTSADFWTLFRRHCATTLAGVPYTFDLLDRVGFASMELPTLRYVTQAGGRLDPAAVRRYAALGEQRGFDLFVMYGQTEATARMAYLPPDLARSCAGAIGIPIPGGSFRLSDEGELLYSGENVMLGHATSPAELGLGREVTELRTGDLARLRPDGLIEITGRASRFAKVFGLRVDLDRVEQLLAAGDLLVHCADGGDRVVVAIDVSAKPADLSRVSSAAAAASGLPESSVQVLPLGDLPRVPSGKPDFPAIATQAHTERLGSQPTPGDCRGSDLAALYADVLRRERVRADDSFVSLKGDSLSYVEMSIRLEEALGTLPADWHTTSIRELAALGPRRRRWGRSVETNVVLRAVAIVVVVGSHADLFTLMGGAHVLLGVAGYNFGRFFLRDTHRLERVRHLTGSIVRIAVPSTLWLAFAWTFDPEVTWRNVLLVNGIVGPERWDDSWHYWFVEAMLYTLVGLAGLLSLRWFDRVERRWPFWLPICLAGLALLTRYGVLVLRGGDEIHRAHIVFWLFALGWASVKAASARHRWLVSAMVVATVPGFFDQPHRDVVVVVGMLLLVWVRAVRIPKPLAGPVGVLASASLFIYLCHWQIYPEIEDAGHSFVATAASLLAGAALWWLVGRVTALRPAEIRENLRWLHPRRYATRDAWNAPAAEPNAH